MYRHYPHNFQGNCPPVTGAATSAAHRKMQCNRNHWLYRDLENWWAQPSSYKVTSNTPRYYDAAPGTADDEIYKDGFVTDPPYRTPYGQSLRLAGTDAEYRSTDVGGLANTSTFTIGFWCKFKHTDTGAIFSTTKINTTETIAIYGYDTVDGNGARVYYNQGNNFIIKETSGLSTADEWHHYVFASRSSTDHEFWIDGISAGTSARDESLSTTVVYHEIGHVLSAQFYTGEVTNITFHSRGMTDMEVKRWYHPKDRWGLYMPTQPHRTYTEEPTIVSTSAALLTHPHRHTNLGFG